MSAGNVKFRVAEAPSVVVVRVVWLAPVLLSWKVDSPHDVSAGRYDIPVSTSYVVSTTACDGLESDEEEGEANCCSYVIQSTSNHTSPLSPLPIGPALTTLTVCCPNLRPGAAYKSVWNCSGAPCPKNDWVGFESTVRIGSRVSVYNASGTRIQMMTYGSHYRIHGSLVLLRTSFCIHVLSIAPKLDASKAYQKPVP